VNRAGRFLYRHRRIAGSLAGGFAGIIGGFTGFFIGVLLGYLLQEILAQAIEDRSVRSYFDDPELQNLQEGEPGLAAFCALSLYIIGKNPAGQETEAIYEEIIQTVKSVFPRNREEIPFVEAFCRIAVSRLGTINHILLAESLVSRRSSRGDLPLLARALYALAGGPAARETAAGIALILDPAFRAGTGLPGRARAGEEECWRILGLRPGSSAEELKSCYHTLALQFHPDSMAALSPSQQEEAAKAFVKIKEAYLELNRED
jgi:hypothetical protein